MVLHGEKFCVLFTIEAIVKSKLIDFKVLEMKDIYESPSIDIWRLAGIDRVKGYD